MISIGYFSCRKDPKFAWMVESLLRQTTPEQRAQIELIFIDGRLWLDLSLEGITHGGKAPGQFTNGWHDIKRFIEMYDIVNGRLDFAHISAKPNVWNGPFRQSIEEFFAASAYRNSFIVAARYPYLVFCDDLSVLGPQWIAQIFHAAQHGYCVAGAYRKVNDMVVENGELKSFSDFPAGHDSRWGRGSDSGIVPWAGAGMYGCSFGAPLSLLLKVNGSDEHCDGQGGEDTCLGERLERAGGKFFYNRNLLTYESEEHHHLDTSFKRVRKMVKDEFLPQGYVGEKWSDHVMLNRLRNERSRFTTLSTHDMHAIRELYQEQHVFEIPEAGAIDWRDGQLISEM